jgi:hypothetical protein
MKLEYSQQIFEKPSNIKFHKKIPLVEGEVFRSDRQTDRHNKAILGRNFANAPVNRSTM